MSSNQSRAPQSTYVQEVYDSLLPQLPHGYSEYRWGRTAVSRFHYRQSRRALLRGVGSLPERVDRALEIGGGGGAWTRFFADRVAALDFLDISAEMLKEAQQALASSTQIHYIHADFTTWESEPETYDLIVSIRNIEYMSDTTQVLARISRALKKGGTVILSTKSPHFDWRGYFREKALHGGQIPIAVLQQSLETAGLRVEAVYPAIIGKGIRHAPLRVLWDLLQTVLLYVPRVLMPVFALKYLSESFLVVARKYDR